MGICCARLRIFWVNMFYLEFDCFNYNWNFLHSNTQFSLHSSLTNHHIQQQMEKIPTYCFTIYTCKTSIYTSKYFRKFYYKMHNCTVRTLIAFICVCESNICLTYIQNRHRSGGTICGGLCYCFMRLCPHLNSLRSS